MARKARSRAADYAVYLAVRLAVLAVQAMTWRAALVVADLVARLAYRVDRRHRAVAADNLRHAFPGIADAEADRLVRAVYGHFARVAVEMVKLPRAMNRANLDRLAFYPDPTHFETGMTWVRTGRPLLILTGHLGNWELLSYAIGLFGLRGGVVARPLDNPHLDRWVRRFRQRTGQTVLAKKGDFDAMEGLLAGGGYLGILADQDAGPRGAFVDFFGRPASTTKGFALLALEYKAPILVVGGVRVGDPMRYALTLADVILPEDYADRPDAVAAITARYTAALERMVREHPEQYFWLHRRWKTRPRSELRAKAA